MAQFTGHQIIDLFDLICSRQDTRRCPLESPDHRTTSDLIAAFRGVQWNARRAAMCCVGILWLCLYISIGSTWVNLELLDLRRLKFCNLLRPNCCPLRLAQRAVKIFYVTTLHFRPCWTLFILTMPNEFHSWWGKHYCQIPCKHQRIPHSSGSARLKKLCQFSPAPGTNLAGPENRVEQCGLV